MTNHTLTVTIGWTMPSDTDSYRPMLDGYLPGADQHQETFDVEWTNQPTVAEDTMLAAVGVTREEAEAARLTRVVETIAEACFYATNAPRMGYPEGLTGQICRAVDNTGYEGRQAGHYSLSVGDTVTVNEVTVAVERTGWKRVYPAALTV